MLLWPENPKKSDSCLTPSIKVSEDCATRRYFGGRISVALGSLQSGRSFRIVPGASGVQGTYARASLRHRQANSYRSHDQRGTGARLDRAGSGPVILVQNT